MYAKRNEVFFIDNDNDYYLSYNNYDNDIYGNDTTAIVIGQTKFLILNGDHRMQLLIHVRDGLAGCIEYVKNNKKIMNKFSGLL